MYIVRRGMSHRIFVSACSRRVLQTLRRPIRKLSGGANRGDFLNEGVRQHLTDLKMQYKSIQARVNSLTASASSNREENIQKQKLFQQLSSLEPIVQLTEQLQAKERELADLEAELAAEREQELHELMEEELSSCQKSLQHIKQSILRSLIPSEDGDKGKVILEIRAGAGGKEASLFTAEIFHMYQKWAQQRCWKFEVLECDEAPGVPGYKHVSASIQGDDVLSILKHESGVHRVQRIPSTESMGRVHTSTSSVAVLLQPSEIDRVVSSKDLKVETIKSSGPGGQHVNTTDSSVRITHLPTGLMVRVQSDRSQHKNKAKALQIIQAKLYEMKRLEADRAQQKERKEQHGSGERHERIRTYNFPQDRVTDHRVAMTFSGVHLFMKGELDLSDLWNQLQLQEETASIEALLAKHKQQQQTSVTPSISN